MVEIGNFYNITSNAVKNASENSSLQNVSHSTGEFKGLFDKAVENLSTTNAYLSDFENEQVKWMLGESENTHDLSIAMGKASTALSYTVAVRDKFLEAYKEIMQIQI